MLMLFKCYYWLDYTAVLISLNVSHLHYPAHHIILHCIIFYIANWNNLSLYLLLNTLLVLPTSDNVAGGVKTVYNEQSVVISFLNEGASYFNYSIEERSSFRGLFDTLGVQISFILHILGCGVPMYNHII